MSFGRPIQTLRLSPADVKNYFGLGNPAEGCPTAPDGATEPFDRLMPQDIRRRPRRPRAVRVSRLTLAAKSFVFPTLLVVRFPIQPRKVVKGCPIALPRQPIDLRLPFVPAPKSAQGIAGVRQAMPQDVTAVHSAVRKT